MILKLLNIFRGFNRVFMGVNGSRAIASEGFANVSLAGESAGLGEPGRGLSPAGAVALACVERRGRASP